MARPRDDQPYAWYQYFVNTGDADVIKYLRWFTFLTADDSQSWRLQRQSGRMREKRRSDLPRR